MELTSVMGWHHGKIKKNVKASERGGREGGRDRSRERGRRGEGERKGEREGGRREEERGTQIMREGECGREHHISTKFYTSYDLVNLTPAARPKTGFLLCQHTT